MNSKVIWQAPTASGLGDRLCDLLFVRAFAEMVGSELRTFWPGFEIKAVDAPHRQTDILLENVLKYIKLPPAIVFDEPKNILEPPSLSKSDVIFNKYVGGAFTTQTFFDRYVNPHLCLRSFPEFEAAVSKVKTMFGFSAEITDYLKNLPKNFVALHIRRGDKICYTLGTADKYQCHLSEVDYLNTLTYKTIDYFNSAGLKIIFICGDEDEKTKPFHDYALSLGFAIIQTPKMEKWKQTYYDLAIMSKANSIVTAMKYSSFGMFPSLIGNGNFTTSYRIVENVDRYEPLIRG